MESDLPIAGAAGIDAAQDDAVVGGLGVRNQAAGEDFRNRHSTKKRIKATTGAHKHTKVNKPSHNSLVDGQYKKVLKIFKRKNIRISMRLKMGGGYMLELGLSASYDVSYPGLLNTYSSIGC